MRAEPVKKIEFHVENLDCESEANAIRRGLAGAPGLLELTVYPKAGKLSITYAAAASPASFSDRLRTLGYPPRKDLRDHRLPKPWENAKVLTAGGSGILLAVGWILGAAGAPDLLSIVLYLAAILVGGWFFGREAIEELVFEREIGIELLMSVAAVAAAVLGQFAEAATLAFLYSISEAAEGYTEEKTRSAVRALMDLTPRVALVRREGREQEIPAEQLRVGDIFIVRPGQSLATDGEIVSGESSVNQAPVTGESLPVGKGPQDTVFAGSINGEGLLEIRATKVFAENTISRIIKLVEEAQERKGASQRFIERFGAWYSPAVLALGALIGVLTPALVGDWHTWLVRATIFIVAAAPCALVISIPITMVAALGTAARRGVLIKGGIYMEELARITAVALDKTGTVTVGKPEVTDVILLQPLPGVGDRIALLALAAGIEADSEHPLARAIVHHARKQGIKPVEIAEFRALTGAGASARFAGGRVFVGNPRSFQERLGPKFGAVTDPVDRLEREAKTIVLIGDEASAWGIIALSDTIRADAAQAITALRSAGVGRVIMLTGDNERSARAIAHDAGIDEVHAGLTPERKVEKVRELAGTDGHVAMIGDGINDAPALAAANVGIAMGAAGTDVVLETADVALMADDLVKLSYAIDLARKARTITHQNLALSAVLIGGLIVGALSGLLSLPIVVVAHELSELAVIANGLRMLRTRT
ncbi:heavy metal translocating P-type ATPase (plasmid) [Bradyrhizobium denitrificans]